MGKRANGEGTMRLRPDGWWEYKVMVGYKPDGSAHLKSFYGKTQSEAKKKFAAFQAQRDAGIILAAKSVTLGELADRWLELKRQRGEIGENTFSQYRNGLNKFRPLFKQKLEKITALQIDSIYADMLKRALPAERAGRPPKPSRCPQTGGGVGADRAQRPWRGARS